MKKETWPKCGKPGQFSKNRRNADGLCSWCKDYMRAAVQAWNEKNRTYKNAYNRENRDLGYHCEYDRQYYKKRRRP